MTPSCEVSGPELWSQPVSAWTSLAFVVAGVAILVRARRAARTAGTRTDGAVTALGLMTVLIGVGSVVQHGPAPSWNPVAHDPPLMGALTIVAADALADLTGRRMRHWWWLAPTAVVVVLAATTPGTSAAVQGATAVVTVGATLLRALSRPGLRRRLLTAVTLLGVGGAVGTMTRPGWPWCDPGSGWYELGLSGHAVWHVLAATALWVLAPTVGHRAP